MITFICFVFFVALLLDVFVFNVVSYVGKYVLVGGLLIIVFVLVLLVAAFLLCLLLDEGEVVSQAEVPNDVIM